MKKLIVMFLSLLLCFSLTASIPAQTVDSNHLESRLTTVDPGETLFTAKVDPEYLEWMNNAPEEVLKGSTSELLEYFLHSRFLMQCFFSSSSSFDIVTIDFTQHEAFNEFITRKDCLAALENYAKNIQLDIETDDFGKEKLKLILEQPKIKAFYTDIIKNQSDYPYLKSLYDTIIVIPK